MTGGYTNACVHEMAFRVAVTCFRFHNSIFRLFNVRDGNHMTFRTEVFIVVFTCPSNAAIPFAMRSQFVSYQYCPSLCFYFGLLFYPPTGELFSVFSLVHPMRLCCLLFLLYCSQIALITSSLFHQIFYTIVRH